MDYETINNLYKTRQADIVTEILRTIFGTKAASHSHLSLTVTRMKAAQPRGHDRDKVEYAFLIRVPGPVADTSLRRIMIGESNVPFFVKGNYAAPMPL
jgi:hypothetical protein